MYSFCFVDIQLWFVTLCVYLTIIIVVVITLC